jgi:hypothetical protein
MLSYLLETERRFLAGERVSPTPLDTPNMPARVGPTKRRGPVKRLWKWLRHRSAADAA